MENATRAFIMAAGVLLGVLILSLGIYLFSIFGQYSANAYETMEKNQITQFNSQFFKYYGNTTYSYVDENGKEKTIYELSEYIFYFYKWNVISKNKLLEIKSFLEACSENDFVDNPRNFAIERSHPVKKQVLGINFFYTQVKYPMLVHRFEQYEILTEIKITEKQYAIGVQPMLYLCFPIMELKSSQPLIGRTAITKETADFEINSSNISIFLEMLKIFGILSKNHNKDIITIIDKIVS